MFQKIEYTKYPPSYKPMMVYDGKCGFCRYWIIKWQNFTGNHVDYQPFQKVATQYKDIDVSHFKAAVRYIDIDGKIVSGPDAAYITYFLFSSPKFLHRWYLSKKWFQKLSDWGYQFIAEKRSSMFDLSRMLFGKDPNKYRPIWLIYLFIITIVVISLLCFL